MIPDKESLAVEFKSDRGPLPDRELIETAVCLANSEGGEIYLGVEDDGSITGLHPNHAAHFGLAAMIANRTTPPLSVAVTTLEAAGKTVLRIAVPKMRQITATSDGVLKRRRILPNGRPECVPFLPHEFATRQSTLGLLDISAGTVAGASMDDLDPIQRARLRQFIERNAGDRALLALEDAQLDGALGLAARYGDAWTPTLTGLLLIGQVDSLRRLVPTHEIAFQVLHGEDVRLNEFTRAPLVESLEWLETLFKPLNQEKEIQLGMFRVPAPRLDRRAFREALANAVIHRDYNLRGAVHVRLEGDLLTISNPGGLVDGVTIENLLTTEPRPRNPALADACKRIGMVERTGRGVALIYRGMLRYGRHRPDYSRTDAMNVVLRLHLTDPDLAFLEMILKEEDRRGEALPIDSLIALSALKEHRRITAADLAELIGKSRASAARILEVLIEAGLVQPHGAARGRTYTLSPQIYRDFGEEVEYTRQVGFDKIQQEQMVRRHVMEHGSIRRADVMALCRLDRNQAYRLLRKLVDQEILKQQEKKRLAHYTAGPQF